jgi:dTDP-glucose 4,6-dehydratase
MRLLITGGAGFIGSNYARRIIDGTLSGISNVTVLDKLTYAGTLTNLDSVPTDSMEFIQGDICNRDLVNKLVANCDAIVNFAAESHVDRSILNAQAFVETNVIGTQVLLDSVKDGKRFVQISTDEVYGSINKGCWSEDSPLLPNSPYSASKAAADLLTRSYFRTFAANVSITRSSNNYGPHQFPEKIIPLFITNLIDDQKVPLYGEGLNVRDWIHVDDHCKGIHAVLLSGKAGEIYNIGGGAELSNIELSSRILEALGKDASSIEKVSDRPGHDFRYSVSIEKIKNELLYKPQITFVDGLKDTIRWYQENESWWRPLKQRLAGSV